MRLWRQASIRERRSELLAYLILCPEGDCFSVPRLKEGQIEEAFFFNIYWLSFYLLMFE